MIDNIKDSLGASRFSFAGRVALGFVGFLLAGKPGLPAEGKPYLLRDINQTGAGSWLSGFTALGDRLFFQAYDSTHGRELWVTDGTPEGTVLVKAINPDSGGSYPESFTALGDRLFFTADDGTHGRELWITDGTPEETVLFKDINPGSGGSSPGDFTALGDRLFFWIDDGTHGRELWGTDGTPEGTVPWREYLGQPENWKVSDLPTAFGDRLFFSADDGTHGFEPWVTDGTLEGTVLVKDINPGPVGALNSSIYRPSPDFYPFGDRLFFMADDGTSGTELWVTDGTPEGTSIVEDLLPGPYGSMGCRLIWVRCENIPYCPGLIAHPNGTLFFVADDGVHGNELWALRLCPDGGDTHCLGLEVKGPDGGGPASYVVTASAQDDSVDSISYTFSAKRGDEAPIVIGPQAGSTSSFDLDEGTWTLSVEVDDGAACPDLAADARCSTEVIVGGLRLPGDANGDGGLDISDAVATLGFLFLGSPTKLPCGDGSATDPANLKLIDWQRDGAIDISDAIAMLSFLFLGGPPHALAVPGAETKSCVRIVGCSEHAGCP
jgi:ELWxxDGT repeat protein